MKKVDKRHNYYLMLDTETCNGVMEDDGKLNLNYSLVYDVGMMVVDSKGRVYENISTTLSEIYDSYPELMKTAYYAEKLPWYEEEMEVGRRVKMSMWEIRKILLDWWKEYDIIAVVAHNAQFDHRALNNTIRFCTGSKYRYFLPKDVEWYDTLKMARQVLAKDTKYISFCEENQYMTKHSKPRVRLTAEIIYRFISSNLDFEEEHMGMCDTWIEKDILSYCLAHGGKDLKKKMYED